MIGVEDVTGTLGGVTILAEEIVLWWRNIETTVVLTNLGFSNLFEEKLILMKLVNISVASFRLDT